jgi:hypothetical protein
MPKVDKFKGLAIVATYLSPGVTAGAAGIGIVNGKIVRIPPRGPAYSLLNQAFKAMKAKGKGR